MYIHTCSKASWTLILIFCLSIQVIENSINVDWVFYDPGIDPLNIL